MSQDRDVPESPCDTMYRGPLPMAADTSAVRTPSMSMSATSCASLSSSIAAIENCRCWSGVRQNSSEASRMVGSRPMDATWPLTASPIGSRDPPAAGMERSRMHSRKGWIVSGRGSDTEGPMAGPLSGGSTDGAEREDASMVADHPAVLAPSSPETTKVGNGGICASSLPVLASVLVAVCKASLTRHI